MSGINQQKPNPLTDLNPTKLLSFAGTWNTDFGALELQIQGNQVTGSYGPNSGQLTGILSGNVVQGTWRQRAPCALGLTWGTFTLTISSDGRSFSGRWNYLDELAPGGGSWVGKK